MNAILFATVYIGVNIDERVLDVFQFFMWFLVVCGGLAFFIEDEKLFDKEYKTGKLGIILMIAKVILCIWAGMVVLAAFYLVVSIIHKVRELAYLENINELL